MIKAEAKQIEKKLLSQVIQLNLGLTRKDHCKIAKLIAKNLKDKTNDATYQYVINNLNDVISS